MTRATPDPQIRVLLDRIERLLPHAPLREVSMFGAIAVMLDEAMVVAVQKDRSLLVRVDPAADHVLLERPEASRAEMGTGRSMGAGWIRVQPEAIENDDTVAVWIDSALAFHQRRHETTAGDHNSR